MSHFVYIVKCADKTLYTGYTNNLEKRLISHNESKRGARYTRARRPVVLVYFKKFRLKGKALSREAEIKNLSREKKLKLISGAMV
jgi:putative endonuclease